MIAPTITLNLPALHSGQREVANDPARYKVLAAGRRWGKTRLGAAMCLKVAADGGRAWWIAPSYRMSEVGWRLIRRMARQVPGAEIRLADRLVILPGGGEVQVRSADNPDSLRGEGLDFVVMDECAFMAEEAWTEAIRPALADREGRAMFISTPKGQNWYYRLWLRCTDPLQTEWKGWQLPTTANPYIPDSEIEAARETMPERTFRQEFMAEFLAETGENTFRREWWHEQNRHTIGEYENVALARFQSWDTAEEAGDDNAYTVCVTGEILRDYRLAIRHVYRARLTFDALPQTIEAMARQWNVDNKLKMIVLEDMSSGRSAKHTLKATAPRWLRDRLHPLRPVGSKEARASAASVWCRNGMVMLPHPGPGAEWLLDFEDELFSFPQSAYKDQVDAFGQLIFYCQNYLAEGYKARRGKTI